MGENMLNENKSKRKNILVGIIIFVFLIVISIRLLHMEDVPTNDSDKVEYTVNVKGKSAYDKMLDYMNEKYDDEFTFKSPFGGGAGADTKQMIVSSKKYPEYDIWVEYSYNNNEFYDNYTDYKFKKEYEKCLSNEIEAVLNCEASVVREIATSGCYATFDKNVSFNEYMNSYEQISDFTAVIKHADISNKSKIEAALSSVFGKYSSGFYGNVYFVEENEELEEFFKLDISSMDEYVNVFIKKTDEGIASYEWREAII